MDNKDYKYQYSQSDGNGGILVARTDERTEVADLIETVNRLMGKGAPKVASMPVVAPQTPIVETGLFCKKHQTSMKLNKNGKPYHMDRSRPEGDMFCNGRGYPSEFAGQSSEEIGKQL